MKRKGKTRLPRVALLAYSPRELQRFVEAAEKVAAAAIDLTNLSRALAELVNDLAQAFPEPRKRRPKPAEPSSAASNSD